MQDISSRDIVAELDVKERETAALRKALAEREAAAQQEPPAECEAAALQEARADRKAGQINAWFDTGATGPTRRQLDELAATLAQKVSQTAFNLIVQHETGGQNYYERVYGGHPEWPGGASGITIGFGYDLGYVSATEFKADWSSALGQSVVDRFINTHTIGANGSGLGASRMKTLVRQLRDIVIIWETAEKVFRSTTLPKFALLTDRHLPNCEELNGDCFGALVSVTFNRGASYDMSGDRYTEMRAIKKAMQNKTFSEIPGLIRDMTRIWAWTSIEAEMRRRREDEAKLFEKGLAVLTAAASTAAAQREFQPTWLEVKEVDFSGRAPDIDFFEDITEEESAAAAQVTYGRGEDVEMAARAASVTWPADNIAPDYAHLPAPPQIGLSFTLRAEDLELMARLNAFPVDGSGSMPILFGLRGCLIAAGSSGDDGSWRDEAVLKDVRPNHIDTRCTMGLWNRAHKKIAVFPGSTVPNTRAVISWYKHHRSGNLLPTGLYRYSVGVHRGTPGCFRLADAQGNGRPVVVRRSSNNLYYDLADIFDPCAPLDDIHPTFGRSEHYFSSFGCQTVIGVGTAGHHSGPWSRFRALAGLTTPSGTPGAQYLYILMTGREAYLVADLRRKNLATDTASLHSLRRLRFGSKGPEVAALQQRLSEAPPDGDFGIETSLLLHKQQRKADRNASDGIYSPQTDSNLGWGVFGEPLVS
jgi:hypothetical protein